MGKIEEIEEEKCSNWHSLFGCYMKYILNIADQKNDPLFTKMIKKKLFDLADSVIKKGFLKDEYVKDFYKKEVENEAIYNQK